MTPREVSEALLQTPAPRDYRVAYLAARLAFPRSDRVLIFILSFGLLPAFVGAVFGVVAGIAGVTAVAISESLIPWLFFAYLITWIGGTTFYLRRRHKQFVDVAQYGVVLRVEDPAVQAPPISGDSAAHRSSRRAILVGGYSGTLKTAGTNGVLVKPCNRRALALHHNGISASRVTWKTNVPMATALND